MTDLSPASQTVLDAFLNGCICRPVCNVAFESDRNGLAAALQAAVDQVIPEVTLLGSDYQEIALQEARKELLAIADELEALDD